jgi:hypothetical protein
LQRFNQSVSLSVFCEKRNSWLLNFLSGLLLASQITMGHSQAWLKSGTLYMTNNHCLHVSHHNTTPTVRTSAQHHQLVHQNQKSTWKMKESGLKITSSKS